MRQQEGSPALTDKGSPQSSRTTEDSITADAERAILTAVRWIVTAAVIVFALYVAWVLLWIVAP